MQSSWTVLVPNTLVVFRHAKFGRPQKSGL